MEKQKVWNSQKNFGEENDAVFTLPDFRTFYELLVIKTLWFGIWMDI